MTREMTTASAAAIELAVILTDANGNGTVAVDIGPIASGTYNSEFHRRDAAGCDGVGGVTGAPAWAVDFQVPGPFAKTAKIVFPS
jgi:hypothetical protein